MEATFSSHRAHLFSITIALQFRTSKSNCVSYANISVFTPILFMLAAERFLIDEKKNIYARIPTSIFALISTAQWVSIIFSALFLVAEKNEKTRDKIFE